ncbi:hypothetical protein [Pseudomonas fluorescens]|nr:hypothetical protein [Pseudomonas fluorescens]
MWWVVLSGRAMHSDSGRRGDRIEIGVADGPAGTYWQAAVVKAGMRCDTGARRSHVRHRCRTNSCDA